MGKREEGKTAKRSKKHRGSPEKTKSPTKTKQQIDELDQDSSITYDGTPSREIEIEEAEVMQSDTEENSMNTTSETPEPILTKPSSPPKKPISKSAVPQTSTPNVPQTAANAKKSKRRRESATSSDEERWLSAIETGKLEDVDDELKKIKDPKLMTARQRAMYERGQDKDPNFPISESLMSLPTGYREKEKPQTAEDIQKAALKIQRRKQQADEKREKDKKKTMDRLLRKQESKHRSTARGKIVKTATPMIRYRNTLEGATIDMPVEHEFPLKAQTSRTPPAIQLCGIEGCDQPKVYKCSKTNIPLCSLACYRRNVQNVRQIMC